MAMIKTAAAAAGVLMLAACSAPVVRQEIPQEVAAVKLPARWQLESDVSANKVSEHWWQSFGSPELSGLIDMARQQSWDVAAAVARVNQAAAGARQARAGLFPELTGSLNAAGYRRLDGAQHTASDRMGALLSASYEVDFWGRNRAFRDAAQSGFHASVFDRDTVQLTVTAGVADAWLQVVALRERIGIAQANLATAQRLLQLVESRTRWGAATPLELAQQRGLVAVQQRALASMQQQEADAQTTLALWLGQAENLPLAQTSLTAVQVPAIDQGQPLEIVTRRPDIARAEARLAAADANLQVARAAMLPRLTLQLDLGSESDRLRKVFDNPLYSLGAGLVAPIFDAGRLAAGRDLTAARREELLIAYRQSIVQAFAEVQTALNGVAWTQTRVRAQAEELEQAHKALTLAEARYRAGAESLLTLLDVQRSLYQAQDMAVQLHQERLQKSVALYKALGGGWGRSV